MFHLTCISVSADAVKAYYEADTYAEEILAKIRNGIIPDGVEQNGTVYRYMCEVSETQLLQVTVHVDENGYEILQWQTMSSTEWEADESLKVWDGQPIE